MAWEDAHIVILSDENFTEVRTISRIHEVRLYALLKWGVVHDLDIWVHYGPGWLQFLEVAREYSIDPKVKSYLEDHDKWSDVPIGEAINWEKYTEYYTGSN